MFFVNNKSLPFENVQWTIRIGLNKVRKIYKREYWIQNRINKWIKMDLLINF